MTALLVASSRRVVTPAAVLAAAVHLAAPALRAQVSPPPGPPSGGPAGAPLSSRPARTVRHGGAVPRAAPRQPGAAPSGAATRASSGDPAIFRNGERAVRVEPGAAGTVLLTLTAGRDTVRLTAPRAAVRAAARRTRAVMATTGCTSATGVWDGEEAPDFQAVVQGTTTSVPLQFDCFSEDVGPDQYRQAARVWLQRSGRAVTPIQKLDLTPAQLPALLAALERAP